MGFISLIQIIYRYLCGYYECNEAILVTEIFWSIIFLFLPDLRQNSYLLRFCVVVFSILQDLQGCHKTQLRS